MDPDDVENADGTARNPENGEDDVDDPDAKLGGIVAIGDNTRNGTVSVGTKKAALVGLRDKKIPADKRSTTPYMTKYERARVLGTRALQIRCVFFFFWLGVLIWARGGIDSLWSV